MKISTMGHYGLSSLIDVAVNQARGPVTLNDIATRQSISVKYLWQVINPLKESGFLRATRGAKGGYVLARPPEEITMLDVLTTLEGPVSILKCMTIKDACNRIHSCVSRTVWKEVNTAVESTLERITLAEVLRRCKSLPEAQVPTPG
jgi:Rrf2 family protein